MKGEHTMGKNIPDGGGLDKDDNQGRASTEKRTDNYADTQGFHGDPFRKMITDDEDDE
jgi:hypothetical protein